MTTAQHFFSHRGGGLPAVLGHRFDREALVSAPTTHPTPPPHPTTHHRSNMTCPVHIRIGSVTIDCTIDHTEYVNGVDVLGLVDVRHAGTYPHSITRVEWFGSDRRCFTGDYPGECSVKWCTLPAGHPRRCA